MWCNVGFTECIEGDCDNGYGTYTFANGDKYIGEYKDGEIHGQGTLTYADGRVEKGIWENGQWVKLKEEMKKEKTSKVTDADGGKLWSFNHAISSSSKKDANGEQ